MTPKKRPRFLGERNFDAVVRRPRCPPCAPSHRRSGLPRQPHAPPPLSRKTLLFRAPTLDGPQPFPSRRPPRPGTDGREVPGRSTPSSCPPCRPSATSRQPACCVPSWACATGGPGGPSSRPPGLAWVVAPPCRSLRANALGTLRSSRMAPRRPRACEAPRRLPWRTAAAPRCFAASGPRSYEVALWGRGRLLNAPPAPIGLPSCAFRRCQSRRTDSLVTSTFSSRTWARLGTARTWARSLLAPARVPAGPMTSVTSSRVGGRAPLLLKSYSTEILIA